MLSDRRSDRSVLIWVKTLFDKLSQLRMLFLATNVITLDYSNMSDNLSECSV
jgi:hypothetical protein